MSELPVATVVDVDSWAGHGAELAHALRVLAESANNTVPPHGAGTRSPEIATVEGTRFWADHPRELADALGLAAGATVGDAPGGVGVATGSERLTMTVEEAAAALGISRAFAYEAVRRNEIPSIHIGRRILVPRAALRRMLDIERAEPGDE